MKKNEKINTCHVDEALENRNAPRMKVCKPRKPNKADLDEKIKTMVDEILNKYNYEKCIATVGESENIPPSLLVLLVPTDSNDLAVWNLDYHYHLYQQGKYGAYEFLCKVEALFVALVKEFDELVDFFLTGSIERKERNGYERS